MPKKSDSPAPFLSPSRKAVLGAVAALFAIWLTSNFTRITLFQEGTIRLVLGLLFAFLILFRAKREGEGGGVRVWAVVLCGVAGTLMVVLGLIFRVHQFEWLGLILVFHACLRWALPPTYARDIVYALFLLYWIHPLPGRVFGALQLWMQRLSVIGSEWFLHCLNVRVWGDGLLLRTGLQIFGVPESCSGMRMATTVLLCTLGACILLRQRWFETALFLFLGLFQVLILNIIRISGMVYFAPRMPPEWAEHFLHDTLGIFLLIGILLVQLEVSWWRWWSLRRKTIREGIDAKVLEPRERASRLPHKLQLAVQWWLAATAVLLLAGGVTVAVYKRRPEHRIQMLRDVVEGLMETDLEEALKATRAGLAIMPDDRGLKAKGLQILVLSGRNEEALAAADAIGAPLDTFETILKSWALMGLGRAEEAMALVNSLPANTRDVPVVAIIRAEYAARHDDHETAARCAVLAAHSLMTLPRVRRLYPYLASRERWKAIVESDRDVPYGAVPEAMLSLYAHVRTGEFPGAAAVMRRALAAWPDDPRFLAGLSILAVQSPGAGWDNQFATIFLAHAAALEPDSLATFLGFSFRMWRPDLAWVAYAVLESKDATHPALYWAPAQFGRAWFTFRRHDLALGAGGAESFVDLRPFVPVMRAYGAFRSFWDRVPLADALATGALPALQAEYMGRFVEELDRRDKQGLLSPWMEGKLPMALYRTGRIEEAHRRLDLLAKKFPQRRAETTLQRAELYDRENERGLAYDALQEYFAISETPPLAAYLMLIKQAVSLDLAVVAMETLRTARERYPEAPSLDVAEAMTWDFFGFPSDALFILCPPGKPPLGQPDMVVRLLYQTGRIPAADKQARLLGFPPLNEKDRPPQRGIQPAEQVSHPDWAMLKEGLATARRAGDSAASTGARVHAGIFGEALRKVSEEGLAPAGDDGARLEAWRALGRTPTEQAAALHRLAVLGAAAGEFDMAKAAVREAVALLPFSPIIRRLDVALAQGDLEVVKAARAACPNDPELWLAWLVAISPETGAAREAEESVLDACAAGTFSPETMVRAGDLLYRRGAVSTAREAARWAVRHGEGFLPADMLLLFTNIALKDREGAIQAAVGGVAHAVNPTPFHQAVVALKAGQKEIDPDLLSSLEYLRNALPGDPEWPVRLAMAYFARRDMRRTSAVLEPLMARIDEGVQTGALLVGAEASRVQGNLPRSVQLLESAWKAKPESLAALNNLVYALAQSDNTAARAEQLLPELLARAGDSFEVLDTAAAVYARVGKMELARTYMEKALAALDEGRYGAVETKLNAAELFYKLGDNVRAEKYLDEVIKNSDRMDHVDFAARELLKLIREGRR